jgi:hypothetical protein
MRFPGRITKDTRTYAETHTENIYILIAFPQQQWLHKRSSVFGYTCISCPDISDCVIKLNKIMFHCCNNESLRGTELIEIEKYRTAYVKCVSYRVMRRTYSFAGSEIRLVVVLAGILPIRV